MDETTVLIKELQDGKSEVRKVLVEKNLGLVHAIVKRFIGRGVEAEDLFQIGTIGLMKAIDHFDLSFGVKFSTYAVPMISGEIKRFLRDDGMVKVSRTLKENGMRIKIAVDTFHKSNGREPTIEEISELTGIEREDVILAMEAGSEVESIYRSIYQSDGNEIYLVDQISQGNGKENELLDHLLLEQLLGELSENERTLIILRYFHDRTQTQVANVLGISQVQVSRLEKRILLRLREKL